MSLDIEKRIKSLSNPNKSVIGFKTSKGQYAYNDVFLGVSVPKLRKLAGDIDFLGNIDELEECIKSKFHEVRLCVLFVLVYDYEKAHKNQDLDRKKAIINFYISNIDYVNNWDLVDSSAYKIIGRAIFEGILSDDFLFDLVNSNNLWKKRIAIVSTLYLIKNKRIDETLQLSKILLSYKHDLINKAVGWMLREAWKVNSNRVESFLKECYNDLSRTTLRYAIEKMDEKKRVQFLKGKI